MRKTRRFLGALLVITLIAVIGGYWYARPLLHTGTGYAAHNACAVQHVAERDNAGDDLPPNPLVPFLRTTVEDDAAESTVLGVLAKQRAHYTKWFGCTVADAAPDLPDPAPVTSANRFTALPASTSDSGVEAALDSMFGKNLKDRTQQQLGTRAVVVLKDGQIVGERYADGFDPQTRQLGWSMAKSVTNLMVGRLVQSGEVSLDDAGLTPAWVDERNEITIKDLLRMTSGLEWDETYTLGTPITQMLYGEENMAAYVANQPPQHDPGTVQEYSSGSTTLLCGLLASSTELGANLPRELIFKPLGLTSAVMEVDATGTPVCSSYMWATPRDWAAVGQFALQEGSWQGDELLPQDWMAQSTTLGDVTNPDDAGLASSWWVNDDGAGELVYPELPTDTYMARGHDGQRLIVIPSEELVVVRLGFTPSLEDTRAESGTAELVEALASDQDPA